MDEKDQNETTDNNQEITNPDLATFLAEKETAVLLAKDKEVMVDLTSQRQKTKQELLEIDTKMMAVQRSTRTLMPQFVRLHNYCRVKWQWYYDWHNNPYSSLVHWLTLALYIIGLTILFLSMLFGGPNQKASAASKATWSTTAEWNNWNLDNLTVTSGGLKLSEKTVLGLSTQKLAQAETPIVEDIQSPAPSVSDSIESTPTPMATSLDTDNTAQPNAPPVETPTPEVTQYETQGTATIAFNPQKDEAEQWLSAEAIQSLNNQSIKTEFSTDDVLWTGNATSLANSSILYLRLTFETSDSAVSPILKSLNLNYSRPPVAPQNLAVTKHFNLFGYGTDLSAGAFIDPDNDSHLASQWQVTDQSGVYQKPLKDSGTDKNNLTSYNIQNLKDGTYYFRVRYQDSTGAWSSWSSECNFKIEKGQLAIVASSGSLVSRDTSGVYQAKQGETEVVAERTATFKKFAEPIDPKNPNAQTFRVAGQIGEIQYKLNPDSTTEQFKEIDLSIQSIAGKAYSYAMENNGYQARFYQSQTYGADTLDYVAEYRQEGKWLRMAPTQLLYENTAGEKQIIGQPASGVIPTIDNNNYQITWANVFGPGLDFRYNVGTDQFFKTVIVRDKSSLPAPTIGTDGLKLTVVMSVAWDNNVDPANNFAKSVNPTQLADSPAPTVADEKVKDPTEFSFKDTANQDIWWWQEPKAWDSSDQPNITQAQSQLTRQGSKVTDAISIPNAALTDSSIKFPYYIDMAIAEHRIAVSADDGYSVSNSYLQGGTIASRSISSWYGYVGLPTATNYNASALRFLTIPIPNSATINSASLAVSATGITTAGQYPTMKVVGIGEDNVGTFNATNRNAYDVTWTTAGVGWTPTAWVNGTWYTPPDISTVVSEITARAGWASNNAMGFVVRDDNSSAGYSINFYQNDLSSASTSKFNATYTLAGTGTTRTWDGGGGSNHNWSTATNWSGDTVPVDGDTVVFDSTSSSAATVDASFIAIPDSISVNTGYGGIITQANNLTTTGGSITINAGTWAVATYDLGGGALTIGSTLTIGASTSIGLSVGDLTISVGGALTCSGSSKINIAGSYSNSGTFTKGTSTVTFNAGSTGKTITAGGSAFNSIVFNNPAGGWQLQDSLTGSSLGVGAGTLAIGTQDLTLSGSTGVSGGAITIGASSSIGWTTTAISISSGSVTCTGASIITLTGSSNPFYINGGLVNPFVAGTSTIIFTNNANVSLFSNVSPTVYNLQISPTITANRSYASNGSINVGGTLNINPNSAGNYLLTVDVSFNVTGTTTIQRTGSATSSLTKGGTFPSITIQDGGTFAPASSTNITGTGTPFVINAGGTFTPSTGTVTYTGASATNVTSTTYYNLTLTKASTTFTAAGDITVSNVFTISVSTIFNASSYTLTLSGTTGSPFMLMGTFTYSTSTVKYTGNYASGNTVIVAITFNNLYLDNASEIYTTASSFAVGGTFTINAGTFLPAAAAIISGAGTLTGSGTAQVSRTAATPDFSSQYTITNKTYTNLTVEYMAGAAQTVSAVAYGNLKISTTSSAVATAAGDLSVSGVLTISSGGTFNASSRTITLSGTGTPLVATGTFTVSTSTIAYTGGTTATNITSTTYYNLYLNHASTTYTAAGDITISNVFTINAGTFDASSRTITLSGGGTPFVKTGTLAASTSTFKYTAPLNTNITAADFYNLELVDPPVGETSEAQKGNKEESQKVLPDLINRLGTYGKNILFGPKIINTSLEPDAVLPGQTMVVRVEAEDAFGINEVKADMGGIETIDLKLQEGTNKKGVWQANWLVHDVEHKKYITKITATNILGSSTETEKEWTDPYVLQASPPASYSGPSAWNYSMGYQFTPTQNGQITKLCGYFAGTKWVKLYNSSYSVIASAQVTSSAAWACTAITPVSVSANIVYYVVVEVASNGGYSSSYSVPRTVSSVTVNQCVYQSPSGTFNASHTNAGSNLYGEPDIEITYAAPPTVTISAATNVGYGGATINGNITNNGADNPTVTMYWGKTDGGQTPGNWTYSSAPTSPSQPQGVAAFYNSLSGLDQSTPYYFSAKATNANGTSWPAASLSFTTTVPAVYTLASGTFNIAGHLTIGDGAHLMSVTADTNDPTIDLAGDMTITSNSTFIASDSAGFNVAGNWANTGTFTHSSGTVTLDGVGGSTQVVSGANTFYNLTSTATAARTINFDSGVTQTVAGTWTVTGAANQLITLGRSGGTGTDQWSINPALWSVDYVAPANSNNLASTAISPINYTNGGNDTNWTFGPTGTPPNSPTTLVQKKVTGGATLATGDWTNENTVEFTALASDTDNPDTLYLCVEADVVATAFSSTDGGDLCGTGVAYAGTPVAVSVTLTGLTDASAYHWQAQVKDTAGTYSSFVTYGANTENPPTNPADRDFGVDTTAPTGGTITHSTNTGSLTALGATLSNFDATASGINKYEYAIGTTAGTTDVKAWTDNGTSTTITATGLNLQTSIGYYFTVRATDNATNLGTPVNSAVQTVTPTLSFSLNTNIVDFNHLNASNGWTDNHDVITTVSTNAYNGYTVDMYKTGDLASNTNPVKTISDFVGSWANPVVWGSQLGFGYTSNDTSVQGSNRFAGGTKYTAVPTGSTNSDIVAEHEDAVSGTAGAVTAEHFTLGFKVAVDATQESLDYATQIMCIVTARY